MICRSQNLNWSISVILGSLSFLFCYLGLICFFAFPYVDHTDPSNMLWNVLQLADLLLALVLWRLFLNLFHLKRTKLKEIVKMATKSSNISESSLFIDLCCFFDRTLYENETIKPSSLNLRSDEIHTNYIK